MKTTDLIPLILLELNDSDKYGFELTKSIESKSQGKIVIKQPTLYTILKKLEKAKFISSYWEDSDIGGKRHYYKITDNGRLQVSTLPSFSVLIENALADKDNELDEQSNKVETENNLSSDPTPELFSATPTIEDKVIEENFVEPQEISNIEKEQVQSTQDEHSFSIMDMISDEISNDIKENDKLDSIPVEDNKNIIFTENNNQVTLSPDVKETILPSKEVFANNSLDNLTESEINYSNINIIKPDMEKEVFASNESVSVFTAKEPEISKEYKNKFNTSFDSFISPAKNDNAVQFNYQDVKYVDYSNFSTDKKHVKAKNLVNSLALKVGISCIYLLGMILLSYICAKVTEYSPLFYVTMILGICALIFYPALFFANKEKLRLNYVKSKYKHDFKKHLLLIICIEFVILVSCLIVNIAVGNHSFVKLFSIHNFANIYAEILISSALFIDLLLKYLLTKKYIDME